MNIREAKEELRRTILAYTARTEGGTYRIPTVRQRPVLLMGPPGIGKTAIMEQIAEECGIGLVAYTMTHHTRQSAIGLPQIEKRVFDGTEYVISAEGWGYVDGKTMTTATTLNCYVFNGLVEYEDAVLYDFVSDINYMMGVVDILLTGFELDIMVEDLGFLFYCG